MCVNHEPSPGSARLPDTGASPPSLQREGWFTWLPGTITITGSLSESTLVSHESEIALGVTYIGNVVWALTRFVFIHRLFNGRAKAVKYGVRNGAYHKSEGAWVSNEEQISWVDEPESWVHSTYRESSNSSSPCSNILSFLYWSMKAFFLLKRSNWSKILLNNYDRTL